MIRKTYYFTLEAILAALLIFPYFGSGKPLAMAAIPIASSVLFFSIFAFFADRFGAGAKGLFFILLPGLFLIMFLAGFHPFFTAFLGLFLLWRGLVLMDDDREERELPILAGAMLAALPGVIFAAAKNDSVFMVTILLLLLEIVLALLGRFLKNLTSIAGIFGQKKRYISFFAKMIGILALAGILLAVSMGLLQSVFFFILKGVALAAGLLAAPLMKWLEGKNFEMDPNTYDMESGEEGSANEYETAANPANLEYTEAILAAMAVLAFAGLFYFLYKRRLSVYRGKTDIPQAWFTDVEPPVAVFGNSRKGKPPENALRKEFFHLETFAIKYGYGRQSAETVEEWWGRIGAPINERLLLLYGRVRYGNNEIAADDLEFARQEIQRVKSHISMLRQTSRRMKKDAGPSRAN